MISCRMREMVIAGLQLSSRISSWISPVKLFTLQWYTLVWNRICARNSSVQYCIARVMYSAVLQE